MAGEPAGGPLLAALTTEHFVMQSAIGTSVNEQQARASMYLYSVSGALVAFGVMAQSSNLLMLAAIVVPALFLVGLLTTLRLVDISMESLQCFVTIARIHQRYRGLGEAAATLFDKAHGRWPDGKIDSGHIIGPLLGLLTTAASMIGSVNAMIGATGLAILLVNLVGAATKIAVSAGVVFALLQVWWIYRYQKWRIARVDESARHAGLVPGDEGTAPTKGQDGQRGGPSV